MTVQVLIEELKKMPQCAEVFVEMDGMGTQALSVKKEISWNGEMEKAVVFIKADCMEDDLK